ncbi:MAG: polymerase subunit alpha [Nocardioidaceae bacterium]|nr:polymerase subunit alpha [Nocardioidaceae bacterium]
MISYWTAFLKANFPAEYMAALLTSTRGDKDKSAIYLNECRRMGIQVLPPDVNDSVANFASVGEDIRFGLSAVRNVGENVVAEIVKARETEGRFTDFPDFMDKVSVPVCNKRLIDSLIKAGAFDSLRHTRRSLTLIAEEAVDQYVDVKRNQANGQESLFAGLDEEAFAGMSINVPDVAEWEKATLLAYERDMLGLYVSDHPLRGLEHILRANSDCTIGELTSDTERPENTTVKIAGLVASVERRMSKSGKMWARVNVEDLEGGIEVVLFASAYELAAPQLVEDTIIVVKGRLSRNDDSVEILGKEVTAPNISISESTAPLVVSMPLARCTTETVGSLKSILSDHPGLSEVHLKLVNQNGSKLMKLDDALRVSRSSALIADLKELLGQNCLV